jgi:geranylgeranyl diphosphate synthase type II
MIQSYTLIHDDLPEMDNATMRRDKIANHLIYGHSIALLAGDALLTDTFLVLSNLKISDHQKVALIHLFAQKAGTSGVCFGQTLDMINQTNGFDDWSEIEDMIKYKTCALFELSFQTIGLLALLNDEKLSKLAELGYLYGMAFQIQDDLNDDNLVDDINLIHKTNYHQIFGKEKALEKIDQILSQIEKLCIIIFGEKNKIFAYLKSTFK